MEGSSANCICCSLIKPCSSLVKLTKCHKRPLGPVFILLLQHDKKNVLKGTVFGFILMFLVHTFYAFNNVRKRQLPQLFIT
uniref:Transmembrane protein n=1 Tax=Medicago truncatula TaxID=3880 RepID=I3S0N6_MEDTR|nr:unknown [Medicago truncatula]